MPIRLMQPSFAGGELTPSLFARRDLAKYQVGLALARNVFVRPHGGVSNRAGTRFVAEVYDSAVRSKLLPFEFNTDQTYIMEFADGIMRIFYRGGIVTETPLDVVAAMSDTPVRLTVVGHGFSDGDHIILSSMDAVGGAPDPDAEPGFGSLNERRFRAAPVDADTLDLQWIDGTPVDGSGFAAFVGTGTVARIYSLPTPYTADQILDLVSLQSADVVYLTHPEHPPRKLTRSGHTDWSLSELTFLPKIDPPINVQAETAGGSGSEEYKYIVTAVDKETGEESLPSDEVMITNDLSTSGAINRITWDPHDNAKKYNIYREKYGLFGFVGAAGETEFEDENIDPDVSDGPPTERNPFDGPGSYPSTSTFFEQRLVFAGSKDEPQTVWMSRSGSFENFTISEPTKDDDAVTVTLVSRQIDKIQHLIPLDDLIILTSGGEWRLTGSSDPGYVSPSSVLVQPQSYRGAAKVAPIVVGNTILFLQRHGARVRDIGYSFDVDGYTGNDLTVLAPHLFEGHSIVSWTYAQEPHGLIWVARDDGRAMTLTYLKEHEVWAWCRQETDGEFEEFASIPEGARDAVYCIVKRTIDGAPKRFIERVEPRTPEDAGHGFFVDSGLTHSGAPQRYPDNLHHLNGKTVVAVADGHVIKGLTVADGRIDLGFEAGEIQVGLPFTSDIQTLPIDFESAGGTSQGKRKRVGRVSLRIQNSRGILIGPTDDDLVPVKPKTAATWDGSTEFITGDIDMMIPPHWGRFGDFRIRQSDPLPMTILGLYPEVTIGV